MQENSVVSETECHLAKAPKGRRRNHQGGDAFQAVGTSAIPEFVRHRNRGTVLEQARDALTLAAVPKNLPCREEERLTVSRFVEEVVTDGKSLLSIAFDFSCGCPFRK